MKIIHATINAVSITITIALAFIALSFYQEMQGTKAELDKYKAGLAEILVNVQTLNEVMDRKDEVIAELQDSVQTLADIAMGNLDTGFHSGAFCSWLANRYYVEDVGRIPTWDEMYALATDYRPSVETGEMPTNAPSAMIRNGW